MEIPTQEFRAITQLYQQLYLEPIKGFGEVRAIYKQREKNRKSDTKDDIEYKPKR